MAAARAAGRMGVVAGGPGQGGWAQEVEEATVQECRVAAVATVWAARGVEAVTAREMGEVTGAVATSATAVVVKVTAVAAEMVAECWAAA